MPFLIILFLGLWFDERVTGAIQKIVDKLQEGIKYNSVFSQKWVHQICAIHCRCVVYDAAADSSPEMKLYSISGKILERCT